MPAIKSLTSFNFVIITIFHPKPISFPNRKWAAALPIFSFRNANEGIKSFGQIETDKQDNAKPTGCVPMGVTQIHFARLSLSLICVRKIRELDLTSGCREIGDPLICDSPLTNCSIPYPLIVWKVEPETADHPKISDNLRPFYYWQNALGSDNCNRQFCGLLSDGIRCPGGQVVLEE